MPPIRRPSSTLPRAEAIRRGRAATLSTPPRAAQGTAVTQQAQATIAAQSANPAEKAQLKRYAQSQQAQASQAALPVNFNKMTQAQQYDYLQKLTVQHAAGDESAWKTGDRELNIVGIRSFQGGKAGSAEGNTYNDTIYVARMVDGKKEVQAFKASVDSGVFADPEKAGVGYYDSDGKFRGTTNLADGFYRDAFRRGKVAGGEFGLRQQGLVRLQADQNNDGVIQDNERLGPGGRGVLTGARSQIQFHRGKPEGGVGSSSAGCQAIDAKQFDRFQDLLAQAPASQDARGQGGFSYLLIDSHSLPPADGDFTALRRDQVDQRTVFQNHKLSLWGDDDRLSADFRRGFVDESPLAWLQDDDPGNRGHGRLREYALRSDLDDDDYFFGFSRYGRYGDGKGIIRTPDSKVSSFRSRLFWRWLGP